MRNSAISRLNIATNIVSMPITYLLLVHKVDYGFEMG
jgi:hypothetical protein